MEAQKCPFCDKWIVPYTLIEEKEIDEDFNVNISDIYEGQFNILREGKVKINLLGCPECKRVFIEDKY